VKKFRICGNTRQCHIRVEFCKFFNTNRDKWTRRTFSLLQYKICSETICQGIQRWQYMKELHRSIYKTQRSGFLSPLSHTSCDVKRKILRFTFFNTQWTAQKSLVFLWWYYPVVWFNAGSNHLFDNTFLAFVATAFTVVKIHSREF
jgi:hypothetical protein